MKTRSAIGSLLAMSMAFALPVLAQEKSAEDLAKESEDACTASAVNKPTPEIVIQKVNEACDLIAKEGKASFAKFQGKDSSFIFNGTYIWIGDMEGQMLMHPIKYKMNGTDILGIKDANGKFFFAEFIEVAKKGQGWVDYMWPKPGEKPPSQKVSFVKKVTCDGKEIYAGSGIYDVPPEEIAKLVAGN
ncbi:MAG: cache domain-containing protein [Lentisphaerota bacterium]